MYDPYFRGLVTLHRSPFHGPQATACANGPFEAGLRIDRNDAATLHASRELKLAFQM